MTAVKLYDENELFARLAQGDETAFKAIFDLYKRRLFRYIFYISKSEQVAEELVHDVFLKLWAQQLTLGDVQNPSTYIFTIAKNKAKDYLKKVAAEARLIEGVWAGMSIAHNEMEEYLEAAESSKVIMQAVEQLSPQKKKIYQLSRNEGLTHEQIAHQLNISKSTVNNQLVDALKQIKAFLLKNNPEALLVFIALTTFR